MEPPAKLAFDVVLIPPPWVLEAAIRYNRALSGPEKDEIRLGKEDFIPHISLAMGCLPRENLEDAGKTLSHISRVTRPLDLTIEGVPHDGGGLTATSVLVISRTPDVQSLHETVMRGLAPFFSYDADEGSFYGPVKENAVQWVNHFKTQSAFDKFFPHITIGKGKIEAKVEKVRFTASTLALCHLGNHCACRKIFFSFEF